MASENIAFLCARKLHNCIANLLLRCDSYALLTFASVQQLAHRHRFGIQQVIFQSPAKSNVWLNGTHRMYVRVGFHKHVQYVGDGLIVTLKDLLDVVVATHDRHQRFDTFPH